MPATTLRAHCEKTTREDSVEGEIRTMLELNGWRTHKIEVFKGRKVDYEGRTRRFTEGTPGQADLIAVRVWKEQSPILPISYSRFECMYIECKRPKGGRYSTNQIAWQDVTRRDGFIVLNARSWREVVEGAKKYGITFDK